jgi:hypothetical protein
VEFRRYHHFDRGALVSKHHSLVLFAALASMAVAAPLAAQTRSTVDPNVLDAAVAARTDDNRKFVTSTLTSSAALAVAASMGLSPDAVSARVASLDDASARKVAEKILAGGDSTVVISTTAIIIGLLLLILLTRA